MSDEARQRVWVVISSETDGDEEPYHYNIVRGVFSTKAQAKEFAGSGLYSDDVLCFELDGKEVIDA